MTIRKRVSSKDSGIVVRRPPGGKATAIKSPERKSGFTLAGSELESTLSEIQSTYGQDVAQILAKKKWISERIPTGIFVMDLALAGGFLTSRGSMLYGEKSAGKSTTAMDTVVHAQRLRPDEACAWIDIEGSFDKVWFVKRGGDIDRLVLSEPESGEHAVDIADALSRTKDISVIVTDSIAMLIPMAEQDASAEDNLMGVHARLVGNYLRRLNSAFLQERHRDHRLLVLHINQFRTKLGMVFGDPRTLPGGKALEFCTSQQVEVKNKEIVPDKGEFEGLVVHNEHSFKITKDKTGGRMRTGKYKMVRDPKANGGLPEGTIHQAGSILQFGERVGLVRGKEIIGFGKAAGKDAWMERFVKDPEMHLEIQRQIIDKHLELWGLKDAD